MKYFLLILCEIFFVSSISSQSVKVFDIDVDTDEFYTLETDEGLIVTSASYRILQNNFEPARPYASMKFLLPDQEALEGFSVQVQDSIIMENIILAPTPPVFVCSDNNTLKDTICHENKYEKKYYPLDLTIDESEHDGYNYIEVLFTPIAYDAVSNVLSLAKKIRLTVKTESVGKWNYHYFSIEDNFERFGGMYGIINPEVLWREKKIPSIVESVWSYVNYWTTIDGQEDYNFFRYTVLNEPKEISGYIYYPMVKYTADQYSPEKEEMRIYLREQGSRIFQYVEEKQKDSLLYDFSLNQVCVESRTFQVVDGYTLGILTYDRITTEDGFPFRRIKIGPYNENKLNGHLEWIDGIGNVRDFFAEYVPNAVSLDLTKGTLLNYYSSGDGLVVYKNPYHKKSGYTDFKEDDSAIIRDNSVKNIIAENKILLGISNSTLHCTSPNAAKLEVYTMDAVKVGEARFVNGEATIKVGSTPALYLYIVTYPDGRRESGKVVVNEE